MTTMPSMEQIAALREVLASTETLRSLKVQPFRWGGGAADWGYRIVAEKK